MGTRSGCLPTHVVIEIIVWYASSAVAGSSTRRVLQLWPAPVTLCLLHLGASTIVRVWCAGVGTQKPHPRV